MPAQRSSVCSSDTPDGYLKKSFSPRFASRCVFTQPRPVADSNSVKQRSAVEVIDSKHDSLKIVPPDYGRDIVHSLPYRRRNSPKYRQAIVRFQRASVVALNSVSNKRVVIFVEERAFHLFSTV